MPRDDLTDDELTMLTIERMWWQYSGLKEQYVREKLDMSMTRYYQRLNELIDTERAMADDPFTVKRLQALREKHQRSRSARRLRLV